MIRLGLISYQVRYLSAIRHRNLVTLLGYCQENDQQILVYEYIPNGSVSVHLYGNALSRSFFFLWQVESNIEHWQNKRAYLHSSFSPLFIFISSILVKMSPDFHVICLRSQDYGIHNTLYLSNFLCHLTLCRLFFKILYLSRVIILFFLFVIEVL